MSGAGWHPDPTGRNSMRYWDGSSWTAHVSNGGVESTDSEPVGPPRARRAGAPTSGKKIPAGVCGILLGALGVHKFVLGYTTEGLIMLLVSVLTCGFGALVMGPIGLIEGIMYLTKTDEEFDAIYVENKRGWF